MRATLDWSRDLLSEPERELFRRLSAFSGGFSLEAAEAVGTAAAGSDAVEDVLDLLGTLVEQSLVVAEHGSGGDEPRYGMLEPVRQYAVEKLKESGKAEETRRRHAAFFLYLAERAVPELRGPRQGGWLNRLEAEHGNLQVAIGLLRDRHDTEMVARLGWALWLFWYLRGHSGEGLHWMEEVLSSEDAPALARARASCVAGIMLFRRGAGEPASARLEEALALFQSLGDTAGAMVAAHLAGLMALGSGDTELAEGLLEEGLRLCRSLEDAWSEAIILANLGLIPLVRGDYELAEGYFQQALSLGRTTGNPLVKLPPLYQLAQVAQVQNDHRLAAERYGEALALGVEMQDVEEMGLCLRGLAECAVAEGDHARAGRLYGASDATLESTGAAFRAPQFSPSFHERYLVRARGELGDQTWSDTLEEGRRMPLEEAIGYAFEDKSGTA
jgi:tetratricopeptide (TPR) repeat protein